MEKQVCSIVHEAYARQKQEFFVKKARACFHPVTNFIPKGFNERTFPKEVSKRVSELSLQKLYRSLDLIPILKRK